jgi:hypothetical protein
VGEDEADVDDMGEILYHIEDMEVTRPMEVMVVM